MKKLFLLILLIACFQTISFPMWALISLDELVQESDLIVVGTLQNVSEYSTNGVDYGVGTIIVDEVIWGNSYVGQQLTLRWQNSSWIVCPRVEHRGKENQKGIWLLKSSNDEVRADYPGRFIGIGQREEVAKILDQKPISLLTSTNILNPNDDFIVTLVFRNHTESDKKFPNVAVKGNTLYLNSNSKFEIIQTNGTDQKTSMPFHTNVLFTSHNSSLAVPPGQEIRININLKSSYAHGFKDRDFFALVFKADKHTQSNELRFYVSAEAAHSHSSAKKQQPPIRIIHQKSQSYYTPFVRAVIVFIFSFLLYVWLYRVLNIR